MRERAVPGDGEKEAAADRDTDDGQLEAEETTEVSMLEEVARFDEVVVWGHDAPPDELEDPHVRGLREWIAFAQTVSRADGAACAVFASGCESCALMR